MLYGSAAWEHFGSEGRLLLEERLPFEARYRFRDERVGHVCAAMGRLTSAYFSAMDRVRQNCSLAAVSSGNAINGLLKDAFRALCSTAKTGQSSVTESVEAEYVARLQRTVAL